MSLRRPLNRWRPPWRVVGRPGIRRRGLPLPSILERLNHVPPTWGMKYQSREVAFGKLKAMVDGAAIVCREIGG